MPATVERGEGGADEQLAAGRDGMAGRVLEPQQLARPLVGPPRERDVRRGADRARRPQSLDALDLPHELSTSFAPNGPSAPERRSIRR